MSEIIKILDSRFVTDRDIRVTKALVSSVEYSELKQRITELEQQLKTARKEAFIAGVIKGNPSAEGRSTVDEAAEEYANNLEGK